MSSERRPHPLSWWYSSIDDAVRRYGKMYQCFQKMVAVYETEPSNFARLMELMQDVRATLRTKLGATHYKRRCKSWGSHRRRLSRSSHPASSSALTDCQFSTWCDRAAADVSP